MPDLDSKVLDEIKGKDMDSETVDTVKRNIAEEILDLLDEYLDFNDIVADRITKDLKNRIYSRERAYKKVKEEMHSMRSRIAEAKVIKAQAINSAAVEDLLMSEPDITATALLERIRSGEFDF